MKAILATVTATLFFSICADCSIHAANTNNPWTPWKWAAPYAAKGYVLVRLETVAVKTGFESGGQVVGATFQPVEFTYQEDRPVGGGAGANHDPSNSKAVETKIGKSFNIGIFNGNSGATQPQQSIANLLEACVDENNPKRLKLNLILSIPVAESVDWKEEHDYSHWFVESINIAKQ